MGRRAKHFTTTSKAAAHRESNQRYSESEHGQIVCAAAKRAQYLRKSVRNVLPTTLECIPHLPRLSEEIHRLRHQPLPESETLYEDALHGASYLDLSDISRWMQAPPFIEDDDKTDPYSPNYHLFTRSLGFVLDGVHMRNQQEDHHRRRLDFNARGQAGCMDELRAEVEEMLHKFEALDFEMYHPYHASREYTMFHSYVRWQARTIYNLYYLTFLE